MYKIFLCLRYLRTRWIALASVISVTLGVATLIVVNSVMGGFATEMRDRVKGLLSDLMIEGLGITGFEGSDFHMQRIQEAFSDRIEAMTPIVETPGFLIPTINGKEFVELVHVIGIDMQSYGSVCKFLDYLHEPELRERGSFEVDPAWVDELWRVRRRGSRLWSEPDESALHRAVGGDPMPVVLGAPQSAGAREPAADDADAPRHSDNPFDRSDRPGGRTPAGDSMLSDIELAAPKLRGIIVPYLLATTRWQGRDIDLVRPGDGVRLALPHTSLTRIQIEARQANFVTIGRFKSGMSEYDQVNCYVDIADLQELRGMPGRVNSIYIKLRDYADAPQVAERLRGMFPPPDFQIRSWQQKQGQLLTAVAVEQGILNVLLFMIIAVAGFGILAIFYMIVVEKMRDIGILKSLGASDRGVMQIFLMYGLGLGVVGSGLGMVLGLTIVIYLDEIERWLSRLSGYEVFDRDLYYFDRIPTLIDAWDISWIVFGALAIAVAASVLPARRAAALQPVQTLRYE